MLTKSRRRCWVLCFRHCRIRARARKSWLPSSKLCGCVSLVELKAFAKPYLQVCSGNLVISFSCLQWRKLSRRMWSGCRLCQVHSFQSILKEISPGCSLERMMLKLKLQYSSCEELTHWKRLRCWEGLGAGGKGDEEDEMAGWHHWLDRKSVV